MIFRTLLITATLLAGASTAAWAGGNTPHGRGSMVPTYSVVTKAAPYDKAPYNMTYGRPMPGQIQSAMQGQQRITTVYPSQSDNYKIGDIVYWHEGNTIWQDIDDFFRPAPEGYLYVRDGKNLLLIDRHRRVVDIFRQR